MSDRGYFNPVHVATAAAKPRPEDRLALHMLRAADVCFARIYHRLDVIAPCPLPRSGPAILISNHISGLDPALIQSVCPRLIVWMMAREYYELPALKWMFKQIMAIPVDRSGRDLTATRRALRALHDGLVLGVFPEGRIALTRELLPLQTGVAMMALKTGVSVYPVAIDGTQRNRSMVQACLEPQHSRIAFGDPIRLTTSELHNRTPETATQTFRAELMNLQQSLATARLERSAKSYATKSRKIL